ncbi:MAG: hypothetical protein GF311_17235 [Candidatus Lokiarchaeota archaeon]|nr:hypothetical protein [Candidatus Lokiarchaeota archaeon]
MSKMKTKNISKKKRSEVLKYLSEISLIVQKHNPDSKVINKIMQIEKYLENLNFGLNFEKHYEIIEDKIKESHIFLTKDENLSINGTGNKHILIEGENLAALHHLCLNYNSKIDIICIDPPYNTGNPNLGYNDTDYIEEEDIYSHSKWLNFMNNRMNVAKTLLKPNGVMFINIDETQIGCLILLCHQIFGEENVKVLVWPKVDPKFDINRVEKTPSNLRMIHEYIILCYLDKENTEFNQMRHRPNHTGFNTPEGNYDLESIVFETGTTSSAKDEIKSIFGDRTAFSTPKPMKLIKELIRVGSGHRAVILDFFAGSGTTGHAVIDLNNEDGGGRQFILINNNINNICRNITYKRIKWAFQEYNCKDSLEFLKVKYQKK